MPNRRLIEVAETRGRLRERIAAQRALLAQQTRPVAHALARADQAIAVGRAGLAWVQRHPLQVGAACAAFALLRPRRFWRWSRRAFIAWELWQTLRQRVGALRAGKA